MAWAHHEYALANKCNTKPAITNAQDINVKMCLTRDELARGLHAYVYMFDNNSDNRLYDLVWLI